MCTSPTQIAASVAAAEARFGRIDVLVNNAGIGYFGAIEESDESEVRRMFEINFWGLANVTRAVLPGMRARRSGHIVNMSSIGGLRSTPSLGYYSGTKFAVEGFSEALAQETAPLGVKVLIVEPGGFGPDRAGRSANQSQQLIDDYDATAGARTRQLRGLVGKAPGDPVRAAAAIVQAVEDPTAPQRLVLGKAALAAARDKINSMRRDFESGAAVSEEADFPLP